MIAGPSGAAHPPKTSRTWFDAVGGGQICFDVYEPTTGQGYSNYIMKWDYGGKSWEKKRVVSAASTSALGDIEPIAYLHCFKSMVCSGMITTMRTVPPKAMVNAFAEEHQAELTALHDLMR